MPLISIKRCAEVFSIRRCFQALQLINRHALLLGPLLAATFAIIAGWIAPDYGAQYLFRDNERLDYLVFVIPATPASGNRHGFTARFMPPRSWVWCGRCLS